MKNEHDWTFQNPWLQDEKPTRMTRMQATKHDNTFSAYYTLCMGSTRKYAKHYLNNSDTPSKDKKKLPKIFKIYLTTSDKVIGYISKNIDNKCVEDSLPAICVTFVVR